MNTNKLFFGFLWSAILRVATRSFSIIKIIILTRLLDPSEIGVFGVIMITLSFLEILTETGINTYLIQENDKIEKYIDTAWYVSVLRGFFISLLLLVISVPLANFFGSAQSISIFLFSALIPLFRGLINPAVLRFQIDLEFKKEFHYRSLIFLIDTVITVVLVYLLRSSLGIVLGMVSAIIIEVLISHVFVSPKPKFKYNAKQVGRFFDTGKWITMANIYNYLFHQIDDVIVGKMLGTYWLGIYQIAYKISILPITEGGEIVSKVIFPVYVNIRDNRSKLRKTFFCVFLILCGIFIPLGLVIYFYAYQIVDLVLGYDWLVSVPALKILVIFGVIRAISGTTSALLLALKRQREISVVTLVSLLSLLVSIFPLINSYGITGAAYSALIGSLVSTPFMIYYTYKFIK